MNTTNTTSNKSNKGGTDMEEKLRSLEQQLAAELAKRNDPNEVYDFEAVACIRNEIADLKGKVRPYDAEWFEDL